MRVQNTMALAIPPQYYADIEKVARGQHISTDEAVERVVQAGLEQLSHTELPARTSFASLFGAATGPGTRRSPKEVDRDIAEMRTEW